MPLDHPDISPRSATASPQRRGNWAHWLWLLCLLLLPIQALAAPITEKSPSDVQELGPQLQDISGLPDGFVSRTVEQVRFEYPRSEVDVALALIEAHPEHWQRISSELGGVPDGHLTVRIARSPAEMKRLAPPQAPPPDYATGVAYPGAGLILLSMVTPESWLTHDLETVYIHELSHIALHRTVGHHTVPRWFSEGVAIYQAREQRLSRVRTLWEASVTGGLLPLGELDSHFPTRPHQVNIAYAQSGDFVAHMLASSDDKARFRRMLRDISRGSGFREAVREAYYVSPEFLEREWRAGLNARFTLTPLLLTGGGLWGLLGIVLVWAFIAKRRRDKATLARWAEQEALRAEQAQEQHVLWLTAKGEVVNAPPVTDSWPPRVDAPHHTPSAGVPTVEHNGEQHTLH